MKPKAIVLTDGMLHQADAKTAHGLIRGTDRYEIVAVIDGVHAGKDAGNVLDGIHRNIPVFANIEEALTAIDDITYCIIGIATIGGKLPPHFIPTLEAGIRQHISLVNGLHDFLINIPSLVALSKEYNVQLIDVRKPKPRQDLRVRSISKKLVTCAATCLAWRM